MYPSPRSRCDVIDGATQQDLLRVVYKVEPYPRVHHRDTPTGRVQESSRKALRKCFSWSWRCLVCCRMCRKRVSFSCAVSPIRSVWIGSAKYDRTLLENRSGCRQTPGPKLQITSAGRTLTLLRVPCILAWVSRLAINQLRCWGASSLACWNPHSFLVYRTWRLCCRGTGAV